MTNIAEALIFATIYINDRTDDMDDQDDVKALEYIAYHLGKCTKEEKTILENTISMLLERESDPAWQNDLKNWMQNMGLAEA